MGLQNLKKLSRSLSRFDWGNELVKIVKNNQDAIITLQEEQMYEGKDKNGDQIALEGRGYSKYTFEIKTAKGQPTDRVTWYDTGALYAALKATVKDGNYTFSAPGEEEKFKTMIERSGEDVLGLDDERRLQFATKITLPAIDQVFREKTTLSIL